jgi:hypothetical protein
MVAEAGGRYRENSDSTSLLTDSEPFVARVVLLGFQVLST